MMIQLPSELLHITFRFIDDDHTLLSLLLVSHCIHAEAKVILYEDVRFIEREHINSGSNMTSRFKMFYESITASNCRLANCVKRFSVVSHAYPFPMQMQEYLDRILGQLVHLQTFRFDHTAYVSPRAGFLKLPISSINKIPISLKHFRWDHRLEANDSLITLLQSQRWLQRLELPRFHTPISLAPTALPYLRVLDCGVQTALSILPERHPTHLRTMFIHDNLDWAPAAKALCSIRVFCSQGLYKSVIKLASLMPSLEYLEIHMKNLYFPNLTLLLGEMHKLESTRVRYLRITGHHSWTYYSTAPDAASKYFDLLPNLHCVEFQKTIDGTYGRWYRHCQEHPIFIDWPDGWDWAEVGDWEAGYRVVNHFGVKASHKQLLTG